MNRSHLSAIIDRHAPQHTPSEAAFMRRVHAKGVEIYAARLQQYGFIHRRAVLDAGCGFGQWGLALARANTEVDAYDISASRVAFVADAVKASRLQNIRVRVADISRLPTADASFDGVFCYGALHMTPWRRTLAELSRVLGPGGLLYVNANGFGWYKHLWIAEPHKSFDYDPRLRTARTLLNTCRYDAGAEPEPGMDIIIEPSALCRELETLGFEEVEVADEGCLRATDLERAREAAFFRGHYGEDLGVYEVLARKRGGH